ncbi:MAG: hypothetical protein AAFU85_12305 [Planctomycetota bacterium]
MKLRLLSALAAAVMLLPTNSRADHHEEKSNVDSESVWVTSIAPCEGGFVVGTATGLLLRPGAVSRVVADKVNEFETLYEHPAAVWTVATTSDKKRIASSDYRGNLIVYDVASKEPKTHEAAFERWCQSLCVSPDDQFLVAGNESGKVFKWSLQEGKVAKTVELGGASVTCLAFSPDGTQVAASDGSGKVHLLKWPELESVGTISVGEETAWCVAYASDSKRVFVGSGDRKLYQADAKPDAKAESIATGTDWITRIAVSESGEIAASEIGGRIHFASGGNLTTIGAESGVWALCFSGPGKLLVGTRKNGILTAGQTWTLTQATSVETEQEDSDEAEDSSDSESEGSESEDGESEGSETEDGKASEEE